MRLQRYLSRCGLGSRRGCEELIAQGRVAVNGVIVTEPGTKVLEGDEVTLGSRQVRPLGPRYYLLNKPKGFVSVDRDPKGRPYVIDLIPGGRDEGCFPVGRLDLDTTGLMVITNDGELSQMIAHPRHGVEKTYDALLPGRVPVGRIMALEKGATLEDGHRVEDIRIVSIREHADGTSVRITIHEGKRHVVKRIFRTIGFRLKGLHRHTIGGLTVGGMKEGEWRISSRDEIYGAIKARG